jgi:hypothetical protein
LSTSRSELELGDRDLCVNCLTICGLSSVADLGLVALETEIDRAIPMVPTVGDCGSSILGRNEAVVGFADNGAESMACVLRLVFSTDSRGAEDGPCSKDALTGWDIKAVFWEGFRTNSHSGSLRRGAQGTADPLPTPTGMSSESEVKLWCEEGVGVSSCAFVFSSSRSTS